MIHLFIINPAAGSRDRSKLYRQTIEEVCTRKGVAYEIQVSREPGHCRSLAREAALSGEEYRIYACGGDGTLNEVAAGAAGFSNVAVTVFSGGGFNPVPEADPTDGLLDILLVQKVSRLQVAKIVGKYKSGRYKELPDLVRHFRADKITILCDRPNPINLDGELRTAKEVTMSVADEKLRFFFPRGLTWRV